MKGSSVKSTPRSRVFLQLLATATVALALWETLWILTRGIGFSHSWEVLSFLRQSAGRPDVWSAIGSTVALTLVGLAFGLLVALTVGLFMAPSPYLEKSSRGTIYFGRAIPSIALIPLLVASMGSSTSLVFVLVTWLVAIKLIVFVTRGFRDLDTRLADQARILHLPLLTRFTHLYLPAASAQIVTGLRLTVNRAYGAVVLSGLLTGTPGIGQMIRLARLNGDSLAVLSFAVIAGLIGLTFFWVFGEAERAIVKWRPVA